MLIYLIRHGMTKLGEEKRYQGSLDTPLSEAGRLALSRADIIPDRLYVSPLLRARQTADLLFPGIPAAIVPDLREMDFGAFEGRGYWEMEQDSAYQAWVGGGCRGQCPGGEDMETYTSRVCACFSSLVQTSLEAGARSLAVVAHGGTQMAVLERWGRPPRDYWRWQRPCGCGYLLDSKSWPDGLIVLDETVSFTSDTRERTYR